jgi:hypothetical protein
VLLFELSHIRALLLLFPNTFEYFFVVYEAVRLRWDPRRLTAAGIIGAAFAIWVFVKVPQEYWIHVAELDATDILERYGFGVPATTGWDTIVAANVPLLLGCAGVVVIAIAGVRRFVAPLLPPPTGRASFAADGDGAVVSPAVVDRVASRRARRLLDSDLVEKVILTTLVVVIFSRTVPGVDATPAQLTVWVAIIVAANTAISEWLLRRDFRWPSVVVQFVAMMGTNSAIVVAADVMLPLGGGSLQRASTLFLLLLVTLIVMLFDRYRPIYLARRRDDARTEGAGALWRAVAD